MNYNDNELSINIRVNFIHPPSFLPGGFVNIPANESPLFRSAWYHKVMVITLKIKDISSAIRHDDIRGGTSGWHPSTSRKKYFTNQLNAKIILLGFKPCCMLIQFLH